MANIDLEVPEHKKTRDWYKKVARAYAYGYNYPVFFNGQNLTPNQIITRNRLYVFGEQDIGRNYAAVQGTPLQDLNTKHNQIFTLVNSMQGKMVEFVNNFKSFSELLSPTAKSKKDILRSQLMYIVENKDFVETAKQLGIDFNPLNESLAFKTKQDVDAFMETEYREFGAIVAERISQIVLKTSDYANLKPTQFFDVIVAGLTAEDRQIENGVHVEKKLLPESLILDLRDPNGNNFNDTAWYRGYWVNMASPYEILEKESEYLEPQAIEVIRQAAQSTVNGYGLWYTKNVLASPTGNFSYYQVSNGMTLNPVTGMSGVRMYFKAKVDYRYYHGKKGKLTKYRDYNEKGEPIEKNQNRSGIYSNYRWHYVDLWGGEFVGKHGICNNEHYQDGVPLCPMSVYIDGFHAGFYKSRVSRLIDYQDDINLADSKIRLAEFNDLGLNYIIQNMGGESEQGLLKRIYKDFKSQHMTVLKKDIEDSEELARQKFAEAVDFTGSLNVVTIYQTIKDNCIREMNNMMHLPDVTQGLQQSTIGKGVQSQTIQQANTGLAPLFIGFINYIQRGLQLTCNKNKLAFVAPDADEDYVRELIGDNGYEWLKTAVYKDFENFGIYIYPYDAIDPAARERLDAKLNMYAQQERGLTPEEDLTLMQYTSFRDAIAYLRMVYRKREQKAEQAAQQTRMDNLAVSQAQIEAGLEAKKIPADATVKSAEIKSARTSEDNVRNNATKERNTDLEQQVKVLTKQLELAQKKESKD
jgi:hypothetical protein